MLQFLLLLFNHCSFIILLDKGQITTHRITHDVFNTTKPRCLSHINTTSDNITRTIIVIKIWENVKCCIPLCNMLLILLLPSSSLCSVSQSALKILWKKRVKISLIYLLEPQGTRHQFFRLIVIHLLDARCTVEDTAAGGRVWLHWDSRYCRHQHRSLLSAGGGGPWGWINERVCKSGKQICDWFFFCLFGGVLSLLLSDLPEEQAVLLISKRWYCTTDGRIDGWMSSVTQIYATPPAETDGQTDNDRAGAVFDSVWIDTGGHGPHPQQLPRGCCDNLI